MPMSEHATLEFEYRQGALKILFPEIIEEGACLALAAIWLLEKKATSNGVAGSIQRMFGENRRFQGARNGDAQISITREAVVNQLRYEAAKGAANERVDELLGEQGLTVDQAVSDRAEGDAKKSKMSANYLPTMDVEETFLAASSSEYLRRGWGLCVALDLNAGGHAVGLYRSHGGNLHFFDPNMGVYKISAEREFFRAWEERYNNNHRTLTFRGCL